MAGRAGGYAEIIKERVTTQEMMERVGVHVDRRGMAVCPFHGDSDASLKVYLDPRRGWHCYGCHAGGDVIDFAMRWYGIGFREAVSRINEEFALGLPIGEPMTVAQQRAVREEIERARQERQALQRREHEAENAYWAAYDAWLDNERTLQENAPSGLSEPNAAWCVAIVRRDELEETLKDAEERWRLRREERYGNGGRAAEDPQQRRGDGGHRGVYA